ncbi:MFS transporter [Aeromicrobium camelliae]|uniref:MFS transporter n=2 Tax=Aeromicrobium camelliae TaxID=1538144 RepID=A0A3N6ZDY3_9ACTN|nr:MFS transporter [Aeromicrobium camelliae]
MAMMSTSPSARGRVLVGASIILLALNLRVAVSSVGVVMDALQTDLGLSSTAAGLLTTLPMVCFAVFGLGTDAIVRHLGLHRTTVVALVAIASGVALRVLADGPWLFFAMSFLALSGAAIGNVVLPPLVKVHFPDRIGLLSALFGAALMGGATLGSTISVPVSHSDGGWRLALGMWAALAVITLLPWLRMLRHDVKRSLAASDHPLPLSVVARSPLTWAMLACFAAQSGGAYAQFGWFAAMLSDGGVAPDTAGFMLGVLTAVGIPMTLALPWLIRRWGETPALPVAFGVLTVAGWLGVLLAPDAAPVLWAVTLGLGGGAFSWVLAMIGYRTTTAAGTTALSAMTQGPGYLVGATAPFGTGLLHDVTGSWDAPLMVLIGAAVVIAVAGTFIARSAPLESRLGK